MLRSEPFYDFDSQGRLVEHSHEFDIEVNCLVKGNYEVTREGIERAAEQAIVGAKAESAGLTEVEDIEGVDAWISHERAFYHSLQVAARNLTLIAVMTRLTHWVGNYASRVPDCKARSLISKLEFLNKDFVEEPPHPIIFFSQLADLRDSLVHHDGEPEWVNYKGELRQVSEKYVCGTRAEISHDDLVKAIDAAIEQAKWYDDRLKAIPK
jgi:hypothetical protein